MRGIFKGVRPNNCFNWEDDVPFPMTHQDYPFHPAREDNPLAGCQFSLNGIKCGLGDLRPGDKIEVEGRPAIAVRATRTVK